MSIGQPFLLGICMFFVRYEVEDASYAVKKRFMVLGNTNCSTLGFLKNRESVRVLWSLIIVGFAKRRRTDAP
jgi:hypothetical protein